MHFWHIKPKRERPFERRICIWEDDIKVDLKAIGWEDVDWVHLAHDRVQQ
jgi:hypothetical protein